MDNIWNWIACDGGRNRKSGCAFGCLSCRFAMITPICGRGRELPIAACSCRFQREMARYGTAAPKSTAEFYKQVHDLKHARSRRHHLVPTKDLDGQKCAIEAGFTFRHDRRPEHTLD